MSTYLWWTKNGQILCSSYYQKGESVSLPLDSGLALWLALANKTLWKWHCLTSKQVYEMPCTFHSSLLDLRRPNEEGWTSYGERPPKEEPRLPSQQPQPTMKYMHEAIQISQPPVNRLLDQWCLCEPSPSHIKLWLVILAEFCPKGQPTGPPSWLNKKCHELRFRLMP